MESAINKTVTFGIRTEMKVISENVISNKSTDTYSLVQLEGKRGSLKTAKRRFDGTYRLL